MELTVSCAELSNYELEVTTANELGMGKPKQTWQLMPASVTRGFVGIPDAIAFQRGMQWCAVGGCLGIQLL